MKITVLQENLKVGLARVNRAISTRPQLPILANVLIEAKQGKLFLRGTDLELGIKVEVGAKVEEEGKVTVPAKMFLEFVSSIPAGKVEMETKDGGVRVVSGRYKADFQAMEADEYPEFPVIDKQGEGVVVFQNKELNQALHKVVYAAAKDSMRPILTGILIEGKVKKWRVVATDGFRLALNEGAGGGKEFKVVVPHRAVMEVLKLESEEVGFRLLEETNQVVFWSEGVEVVSQVLEGSYPDYERIIPKEFKLRLVVGRESLLEGVMVAQVFARDNSNILKWKVEGDGLRIVSESPEQGKNETFVEAEVEGHSIEIAFNGKFLLDFLQSSKAEEIEIGLGDSLAPGSFKEVGNKDFLYIVMPINL